MRRRIAAVVGTLPVPTFIGSATASTTTATQTLASAMTSAAAAQRMVIVTWSFNEGGGFDVPMTSITITPSVGTPKTATIVEDFHGNQFCEGGIAYAVLDADADAATSINLTMNISTNPFQAFFVTMYTVPSANLSSTTPTGHGHNDATTTTTVSTTINTTSGGFIIATSGSSNVTANSSVISGTETYSEDVDTVGATEQVNSSKASGITTTTASNTVTTTYAQSGSVSIIAAAWR